MALLTLFAFIAGAGTALSPCVLPVLPALLSAGSTGGRRRPVGIVLGLATTFTITIVGFASVINGVGLGNSGTRALAIVVLASFGFATLIPAVGDRIEVAISRVTSRAGGVGGTRFGRDGDGLRSGIAVGGALGFLYAPCAGPILAAVIAVGSASGRTVLVAVAYAAGSAVVLLALALGGRSLSERIRRAGRGPALQRTLGAVMLATAVAMAFNLDVRFQTAIARHLPATVVNPTKSLEDSVSARRELERLRGRSRFAEAQTQALAATPSTARSTLPVIGDAPDFTGNQRWFNTPGGRPLTIAGLRGRVVLVDFWTYTCINCIRTLPHLTAWDARYRKAGLTIVGVHSPEFDFEKSAGNVADAIRQNGIRYPVAQDNDMATWNAWANQYWPAEYLIDARGRVREAHFGEGRYDETEASIRSLLRERGDRALGGMAHPAKTFDPARQSTPETYVGSDRAQGFTPLNSPGDGTRTYAAAPRTLRLNEFALSGRWTVDPEHSVAHTGAALSAQVQGKDVYLVLGPPRGRTGRVQVLLDGSPIRAGAAGSDVHAGVVDVRRQRLYHLVHRGSPEQHRLDLQFGPGVGAFAFTFG